ncbi:MAG: DUF4191 domain-containing protein [Marmoricola sp.]
MAPKKKKSGRIAQLAQSYRVTRQSDPRIGLILLGTFLAVAVVAWAVVWFLLMVGLGFAIVFGILCGILGALLVFGRRAQAAAYAQIEGKPGAAAAALGQLQRGWTLEPMVAFNKQQDVVTRVVGPPGIVLVGDGNPNRVKPLLASERRKHERVASETPIHELIVGDGPDEVPVRKLAKRVRKLGRQVKPAELTDVLNRLKALDATRSNVPLPKGPVPTSMKGMRGNMRGGNLRQR